MTDEASPWLPDDGVGILHGLRVVDLSRVLAGPLTGQMLADQGADVIKIEGPDGDETRTWGPPFYDDGIAAYFVGLNRSKRNLSLDLRQERAREVLLRLIDTADVVIENFKAGTMARWGLDYDTVLAPRHPELIYVRISGFGSDGPLGGLPGYDVVLQAFGGVMSINGYPDREPLRMGVPIVDILTANLTVQGILLALIERRESGRGQLLDMALLDGALSMLHPHSASWLADGRIPQRTGSTHPTIVPYQVFRVDTGDILIAATTLRHFKGVMQVLGRPEVGEDPRFATPSGRLEHRDEIIPLITELLTGRDLQEVTRALTELGVPCGPVNDVGAALTHPQVRHRGMVIDQPGYRGVGVPIAFSRSSHRPATAPARPGADNAAILAGLGLPVDALDSPDPADGDAR